MPAIAVVVLDRKDFWNLRWAFSGYTTAFPFHQICAICNKFCQTLYESIFLLLPQSTFVPQHPTCDWPASCSVFLESRRQWPCGSYLVFRPSDPPDLG